MTKTEILNVIQAFIDDDAVEDGEKQEVLFDISEFADSAACDIADRYLIEQIRSVH